MKKDLKDFIAENPNVVKGEILSKFIQELDSYDLMDIAKYNTKNIQYDAFLKDIDEGVNISLGGLAIFEMQKRLGQDSNQQILFIETLLEVAQSAVNPVTVDNSLAVLEDVLLEQDLIDNDVMDSIYGLLLHNDDDFLVQQRALRILIDEAGTDPKFRPLIKEYINHEDPKARKMVIEMLDVNDKEEEELILLSVYDKEPEVMNVAMRKMQEKPIYKKNSLYIPVTGQEFGLDNLKI